MSIGKLHVSAAEGVVPPRRFARPMSLTLAYATAGRGVPASVLDLVAVDGNAQHFSFEHQLTFDESLKLKLS